VVLLVAVLIDACNQVFPGGIEWALGNTRRISDWLNDLDDSRENDMQWRHFVENRFIDRHILFQIVRVHVVVQTKCICCLHLQLVSGKDALYLWIGKVVVVNIKRPREEVDIAFMYLLECSWMRANSTDLVIEIGDSKIALIFVFIFESAMKNTAIYITAEEDSGESAPHVVGDVDVAKGQLLTGNKNGGVKPLERNFERYDIDLLKATMMGDTRTELRRAMKTVA
jgi:hypothetical protein